MTIEDTDAGEERPPSPDQTAGQMMTGSANMAWALDSGASAHIRGMNPREDHLVYDLPNNERMLIRAAQGSAQVSEGINISVLSIGEVEARRLPGNTQNLLSMGQLVSEGYTSSWEAGQEPVLRSPQGEVIPMTVRDGVPVVGDGEVDEIGNAFRAVLAACISTSIRSKLGSAFALTQAEARGGVPRTAPRGAPRTIAKAQENPFVLRLVGRAARTAARMRRSPSRSQRPVWAV